MSLLALLAATNGPIQTTGCEEVTVKRDSFSGFRELADKPPPKREPTELEQRISQGGWTILLAHFPGMGNQQKASTLAHRLETECGLTDVWTMRTSDGVAVYCGIFGTTNDANAQAVLARVRQTELDAVRYFENTEFVTVGGTSTTQAMNPMNLGQYSGMYTLQIAVFDDKYPDGRRAGAEDYARQLREQGDDAYFYHGPHRSMVTVGMYPYDQAFRSIENPNTPGTTIDAYTERIQQLQERFPRNLVNGYSLMQRTAQDEEAREQPSQLVRVP